MKANDSSMLIKVRIVQFSFGTETTILKDLIDIFVMKNIGTYYLFIEDVENLTVNAIVIRKQKKVTVTNKYADLDRSLLY